MSVRRLRPSVERERCNSAVAASCTGNETGTRGTKRGVVDVPVSRPFVMSGLTIASLTVMALKECKSFPEGRGRSG